MRDGDFESAWRVSDAVMALRLRRDCTHLPRHFQWIWNGEPLAGKRVLIRCYHGLGDTIQFARFVPLVRRVAKSVTLWVQPELIPLLRTIDPAVELLPLHNGAPECEFDIDVESMELPHIFRTTVATIPQNVPYLHVAPAALPKTKKLNVGLVWRAGDWDERRNIRYEQVRALARKCDVVWHIIQRGEPQVDFGEQTGSDDIVEAARVIAALDLMVSIDSMPAHLAGALGVPTWTLLHAHADWRWMRQRNDSPWYPTMRLFRQKRADNWGSVIEAVAESLASWTPVR